MSRLIDQLRASDFPDKSPRDLTLFYGQYLEANKRDDIFAANPDFAQEYASLKDDIARARRPSYVEELKGSIGSAVHELQASVFAVGALAAHGAKSIGIPGAEPIRNNLLKLMREQEAEAAEFQPSVGSYERISGEHPIEDSARFATYALGTVAPSIAQAAISAAAGAGAGALLGSAAPGPGTVVGAASGALLGLAERKLAQKAVSKLLEQGIKTVTLEEAAKALPREMVLAEAKRLAMQYGGQAALAASSIGQEVGSIYGDNPEAPGTALAYGIPAGLLDVIPEAYIASRFLGAGKRVAEAEIKQSVGYFRRFAAEAAKVVPMEGTTEAAQTLLEIAAAKSGRGEPADSFTDADYRQMLNAGIVGAIGGLAMAPGSALANPNARRDPSARLGETVVERLPLGIPEESRGPMNFGAGDGLLEGDLGLIEPPTPGPFAEATNPMSAIGEAIVPDADFDPFVRARPAFQSAEVFVQNETDPSMGLFSESGGRGNWVSPQSAIGEVPAAPAVEVELPKSVQKTVDHVEETVASVVEAAQPKAPIPAGSPELAAAQPQQWWYMGEDGQPQGPFQADQLNGILYEDTPVWVSGISQHDQDWRPLKSVIAEHFTPAPPAVEAAPAELAAAAAAQPEPTRVSKVPVPVVESIDERYSQPKETVLPAPPPLALDESYRATREVAPATQEVAPSVPPVPVPVIATTGVVTQPTAQQVVAATNGVKTLPAEAPNIARVVFYPREQPTRALIEDENGPLPLPAQSAPPIGSEYTQLSAYKELKRRIGKEKRSKSLAAVILVDKDTGRAYLRHAYGGDNDQVFLADSGRNNGGAFDFDHGTTPFSFNKLTAVLGRDRNPRFYIAGIVTLKGVKPGATSWNFEGGEAGMLSHPGLAKANRTELQNKETKTKAVDNMPAASLGRYEFPEALATWLAQTGTKVTDPAVVKRATEYALIQRKSHPAMTDKDFAKYVPNLLENIHLWKNTIRAQETKISADYIAATASTIDLFRSTLRALTESRGVDVAAFEQGVMGALNSAAQTTGIVIDPGTGRKIVAFGLSSINGPLNTESILSLLHETAHVVTDGLSEPLRVAFQEAVGRMSWQARERDHFTPNMAVEPSPKSGVRVGDANSQVREALSEYKNAATISPSEMESRGLLSVRQAELLRTLQSVAQKFGLYVPIEIAEVTGGDAAFNPNTGGIKVSPNMRDARFGRILLHELAHALTHIGIRHARGELNTMTGEISEAIPRAGVSRQQLQDASARINELMNVARDAADKTPGTRFYGLKNASEFVAEAFSSVKFQRFLASIPANSKTGSPSLFDEFIAIVKRLLGISAGQATLLTEVISVSDPFVGATVTKGRMLMSAFSPSETETQYERDAGWLMNPRSLDIRLLANADPAQLSPEQRAALERLTPEEIAAARRIDPAALIEEQMAEHLAQLGWDRSEAKGVVQKLIRFVKELWLRMAMAIQTALKGPENLNPDLARRFVENRFLQFIHRDSAYARDRINDLLTWIGAPATPQQTIPVFPAGNDWDQRMRYVDVATGELIPVDHATFTPDSQLAYLKESLDRAAAWVREHPPGSTPDTPDLRFNQKVAFNGVLSYTPTEQWNSIVAPLNQVEGVYRRIAANEEIRRTLPRDSDFQRDWLSVPDKQRPSSLKAEAEAQAKGAPDPLTGAPVAYNADVTIDQLPSTEETLLDRENRPVKVQLSSTQDFALKQAILALNDTASRVQRKIARDTDRIEVLERQRKKNPADFPQAALDELDDLKEGVPLRQKIAAQLAVETNALLFKFRPGDIVHVAAGAEFFTVPTPDATEAQIRAAPKGVVPKDLKFADRGAFGAKLSAMNDWLTNPDNQLKGQIYGIIAEQYRKLMDIPVGLEAAGTKAFLRSAPTGGIVDELRATGLPSLRNVGKKFYEVTSITSAHSEDARILGSRWSEAFSEMAKALKQPADQSFYERFWDPLMRIWENFDVAERGKVGTGDEGALFGRLADAAKIQTGFDLGSESERAALRKLMMASIDTERMVRTIFEQNPGLKVQDKDLGVYRRLITLGMISGRRTASRDITGLFLRMNPEWSDTQNIGPDDQRTFRQAAGELYRDDRKAFDARVAELFAGNVVPDFVEPLVDNNVQLFDAVGEDGVARKASLLRVRQAWREANGDVTRFGEILHGLEGGKQGMEWRTVGEMLGAFRNRFDSIKRDNDSRNGAQHLGIEVFARQLMDSREANDWPAQWVSYAPYDEKSNLILLHQLSWQASFGPDPLMAQAEMAQTIKSAREELTERHTVFDDLHRAGKTQREIEAAMGRDDFLIAKNAERTGTALNTIEKAFRLLTSGDNYLVQDFRTLNTLLGASATLRLQNLRSGGVNLIGDLGGPLVALKLSTPALKGMKTQIETLARDIGNGVLLAFGQNAVFNVEAAERLVRIGNKDSAAAITWDQNKANLGPGQMLAEPSGYESPGAKATRLLRRGAELVRNTIPNIGSPLQRSEVPLAPKIRAGFFATTSQWTLNANTEVGKTVFGDLAARGVEYIRKIPALERAQFLADLKFGVKDLDAQQLGYTRGWLLNDEAAFAQLKDSIETKLPGEKGVGTFVEKAYRRMEAAQAAAEHGEGDGSWETISDSQFTAIANLTATEYTLQANVANLPYWMQGPLRPLFTFLTWPYLAMRKFGSLFTDPQGRMTWLGMNSTVADGMRALFVTIVPTTIAGSFAVDWYDERWLGKKQNLRNISAAAALPGIGAFTDPMAVIERFGRYGRAGLAGDIVSQMVNFDTQRNLSLDNRIVAVNTIKATIDAMVTIPWAQEGNLTYASWGRQLLNAAGAGGALQYLQLMQNALGLDNQDAAINSRINTGNYLRAAGRELNLPVAVFAGPTSVPTPISPYLQQMELGALIGNNELFRDAYRNAVQAARDEKKENPEKYVADSFAERHPLKRLFKGAVSETDYRKMLGAMDSFGATQVRASINSYNRFLASWFAKKAYYGKADKDGQSVEQLIRAATRINAGIENDVESLLTIR